MDTIERVVSHEQKYLMFYLENEHYGLPILKVNEIIGVVEITPIPRMPRFIKGIINLRGKIIPVLDLRLKFSMDSRVYDEHTCIIITEIDVNNHENVVGIVVDKVAEVVNVDSVDIEEPPKCGQDMDGGFLTGIGKVKGNVVMLLDIEKIISNKDVVELIPNDEKSELENEFKEIKKEMKNGVA